jgi:DMSO/TMAO reductase YedYZ molybdopterin-dependent catalytic subunit
MRLNAKWGVALLLVVSVIIAAGFIGLTVKSEQTITPNDQFFVVSISSPPPINVSVWGLTIDGLVDNPVNLSYASLTARPNTTEAVTLDCVTGRSATAYWTGTSLKGVLDTVGVKGNATKVVFLCADGYSTSLTIEEASKPDVILAWGMNGVILPADQGYPLRLVVPNNFGYKWAKFITHIQLVNYDFRGYWETAGWADDATITPITDWKVHAALLSVAAGLGTFSALSGMRNSQTATLAKRIPAIFAKRYHRYVSGAFYLLLFGTFLFWALETYDLRGALFYTLHGRMALLTVLFGLVGVLTGLPMLSGDRIRVAHWVANMTAFLLLIVTIALGIARAVG